jgi:hypothetical protein
VTCALWVVGPPAAGKTTIVRELIGFLEAPPVLVERPKWSLAYGGCVVAAGHYTGETFDGADQVGYNQTRETLEYWRDRLRPVAALTVFDGDRFSHAGAVDFMRPLVDAVRVMYVDECEDLLRIRREERQWDPDPTWLKGRVTKARKFAELFT